ncbi:efflux RND transporter permease subunit [cf. Phormidesmis sp. LEGE 11477]|uniref:efflux RND transporter permease subunit n=1 Tax=cf. Phormidesmis sp. LEGE 11477 TaxID=1828680 RepID=UPI001880E185|nr:efflux RND transporter permease subunit [cf. Phormidesmis sp. LEGE 11477]MBE9062124.1 efflux RND transporter permease subunit [cf. Phormidesmis sp. LEGE 11477]
MVRPFFRNVRLLVLTIVILLAWGYSSFQALPRQEDPTQVSRVAVINTLFPGASAERVEALVTEVIESEAAEIEEVKTITSTSRVGFSAVAVELQESVEESEPVWSRLRDKLEDANGLFPQGVFEPELEATETRAYAMITALTWDQDSEPNYAILRRFGEEFEIQMRDVSGTEEVAEFGVPSEEISVEISAPDLAAVGLSAQQLAQQIEQSDAKVTAGQLRNPNENLAIEIDSELSSLEQIRQIPIQSNRGRFTRLGDVARVTRGVRTPATDLAFVNGKPAVAYGILMSPGQRIDRWADSMLDQIEDFRAQLPGGVSLSILLNQSEYVDARLGQLISNLVFGAALVVVVTFVTMGWRCSLIVGTALPLSICAVLGLMNAIGIPIHQISVAGLIIALGLLIDNAVVAVDEIQVELKHGVQPEKAVVSTVKYLQGPLFASTLTTMMTFLPIALLPGGAGEFVGSIAMTVILSIGASLVLSLTVIAALAGRILGESEADIEKMKQQSSLNAFQRFFRLLMKPGAWWNDGWSPRRLGDFYRWTVKRALAKPVFAIVLTMVIPAVGFIQAGSLETQFFPALARDQFQIEVEFSQETAIANSKEQVMQARDLLLDYEQVVEVHWFIGESSPKFYYNISSTRENSPYYAQALVQLNSSDNVTALIREIQADLNLALPDARVLVRQLEQGPPFDAPVELRIYGPNIEELRAIGAEVREILTTVPDVVHVRDDLTATVPKLALQIDEEQARLAGVSNAEVAQQLQATLEGAVGGSILESTENLPVRVQITDSDHGNLAQIESLNLQPSLTASAQDGKFRTVSALGEFKIVPQLSQIAHRNEQRVNTVQAFITAGVLPSKVLADFQSAMEEQGFDLPPGYTTEIGGEQAESSDATGDLLGSVGLLLVTMATALVLSLRSFRSAGIVAAIGVGSVGMALFSLWAFGSLLGFMAIVGTMGLIGIAINGGIIVLSAVNEDELASQGDRNAIQNVVMRSTRHVLTTTITTMVGFVPLLLSGDPFWHPLSVAIAGGIGGSPLLALYFTPAAYLIMHRQDRSRKASKEKRATDILSST